MRETPIFTIDEKTGKRTDYSSLKAAAEEMGVKSSTVRYWIKRRRLHSYQGRRWHYAKTNQVNRV